MDNSTWYCSDSNNGFGSCIIFPLATEVGAIRRKADDEFEDQIYQIASLDLSSGYWAITSITARWAG